jgi:AraC-like DNA-binding protein
MERDQIAKAIKLYLDENYKNHITLSTITENFFISHSTACHYFKEEYSTTIKAYINKKRATEAKRLIESGILPTAVCTKLGFDNYTTFYRVYKSHFGVSPNNKKSQD